MGRTRRVMVLSAAIGALAAVGPSTAQTGGRQFEAAADAYARKLLADGKRIFRFDTFGSEDFWGGRLKLHRAIQGQKLGGVGPGLAPRRRSSSASRSTWRRCRRMSPPPSRPARST